jgi:hypothetical protein
MVRDGDRYETIILYQIKGLNRLQNHGHVHDSKTKESLYILFNTSDLFLEFDLNFLHINC